MELISEEEWERRLKEDKEYKIISFDWDKKITRVFEILTQKMYDVKGKHVGKRLMLEIIEVE